MKLPDLLFLFRSESIMVSLIDDFQLICVAPKFSPVFEPYMNREVAWVDLPDDKKLGDICITLEMESED